MKQLRGLYAITDAELIAEENFTVAIELTLKGGAQLIKSENREKRLQQAQTLKALCETYNALLIINDDVELAKQVDAHGVHLGIDDASIHAARKQLGTEKIIGVSCYNRFDLALQANDQGADYIAFGSFYASPTKPNAVKADINLLHQAKQKIGLPLCAIGGITLNNASQLVEAGADMLAVISSVFAEDDIQSASQSFQQLFD